jgi:hypothetical protein
LEVSVIALHILISIRSIVPSYDEGDTLQIFSELLQMLFDVFIFLFVFLVFSVAFALAFHVMVGHQLDAYRSWGISM